ncbi:MAG: transposase, partial [Myxococcales bacterium]|nr:transposase [Myxococcales bacterium]
MSDLETGEPVWIGHGRSETTLQNWLESLSLEQRSTIKLFAMDLHRGFWNAVDGVPGLSTLSVVHDPFHILKLAGAMLGEAPSRSLLPRGPRVARRRQGTPLAPAPRLQVHSEDQRTDLKMLLAHSRRKPAPTGSRGGLREVLRERPRSAMKAGLDRILSSDQPALHPSAAPTAILSMSGTTLGSLPWPSTAPLLGESKRSTTTGRRWSKGPRIPDHAYLLRKLRFMTANPIREGDGIRRFLALGLNPASPTRSGGLTNMRSHAARLLTK